MEEELNIIMEKVEKHINNMIKNKEIEFVKDEKDFHDKYKKFKKRINHLLKPKQLFTAVKEPYKFIYEFELILREMSLTGVVSDEWAISQRERLYRELKSPHEFKAWVDYSRYRIINHIKNKK